MKCSPRERTRYNLEPAAGIEPAFSSLPKRCVTILLYGLEFGRTRRDRTADIPLVRRVLLPLSYGPLEPAVGIEPTYPFLRGMCIATMLYGQKSFWSDNVDPGAQLCGRENRTKLGPPRRTRTSESANAAGLQPTPFAAREPVDETWCLW